METSQSISYASAIAIGTDGFDLLDAIYAETTPASIRRLEAVDILRQVWLQQDYAPSEGKVQLRTEKDGPPHAKRIFSPLMIQEDDEALAKARERQKTAEFKKEYSLISDCARSDRALSLFVEFANRIRFVQ